MPPQSLEPQGIWHGAQETRSREAKDINNVRQGYSRLAVPGLTSTEQGQPALPRRQPALDRLSPESTAGSQEGRLSNWWSGRSQSRRKRCHETKPCRKQRGLHAGRKGPRYAFRL